jgi:hypothetical protein
MPTLDVSLQDVPHITYIFFVYIVPLFLGISALIGMLVVLVCYGRAVLAAMRGKLAGFREETPVEPEPAYKLSVFHQAPIDAAIVRDRAMILLRKFSSWYFSDFVTEFLFRRPLLWPFGMLFGIGGAAGAAGAMTMFVFLALSHLLVIRLIWAALFVAALYLRFIEGFSMRWRGVTMDCPHPDCYQQFRLPHYRCPTCGARHEQLVPGSYGVLKRRCQCGTLLPTSEVNGRERLRAFCPHCGRELPPGGRDMRHVHLPMIGGRAVGKSTMVTRIVMALDDLSHETGYELIFPGAEDRQRFVAERAELEAGRDLHPTATLSPRAFLVVLKHAHETNTLVYLYDAAGEVYQQADDERRRQNYLHHADGFLFLIDPFSMTSVRTAYAANLHHHPSIEQRTSHEPPQDVYDRFITTIRGAGSYARRISVIVTKADLFDIHQQFQMEAGTPMHQSSAVRQWLIDNGEANLVLGLEKDFPHVAYFASALDRGKGTGMAQDTAAPRQVLQPVDWILEPESVLEPEPPEPEQWRSRKVAYIVGTALATIVLLIVLVGGGTTVYRYGIGPLFRAPAAGPAAPPPWSAARLLVLSPDLFDGCTMQSPAEDEPVLYYLYARERVNVLSRSADGSWYRIRNEAGEEGWVHARLLPVPIDVARQVAPVSCEDGGEQEKAPDEGEGGGEEVSPE